MNIWYARADDVGRWIDGRRVGAVSILAAGVDLMHGMPAELARIAEPAIAPCTYSPIAVAEFEQQGIPEDHT